MVFENYLLIVLGSRQMICKPLNFKVFIPGQGTFTYGLC